MSHVGQDSDVESRYACPCLNVQIRTSPTQSPSDKNDDEKPDLKRVHVMDNGISVAYLPLTLRIRRTSTFQSQCIQYTSMKCLVCNHLVYRVQQIIPADIEPKDGTIFTDEKVEPEILMSSSGFIDVYSGCVTGRDLLSRIGNPQYSKTFSILLPTTKSMPPRYRPEIPQAPPIEYFSHLAPMFASPPFIPSHHVFKHLATVAVSKSNQLRASAEEEIAKAVSIKSQEIEEQEEQLRVQVETLWSLYNDALREHEKIPATPSSTTPSQGSSYASPNHIHKDGTSVTTIKDFVPSRVKPRRVDSNSTQHVSNLSASLASSSLHQAMSTIKSTAPLQSPFDIPASPTSFISSSSATLTLRPTDIPGEGSNVLDFRRIDNPDINVAVSHQVEQLEELMRQKRAVTTQAKLTNEHSRGVQNENKSTHSNGIAGGSLSSKGKRKVTFDVKPNIVPVHSNTDGGETLSGSTLDKPDNEEMIFDLEDELPQQEESEPSSFLAVSAPQPSDPLSSTVTNSSHTALGQSIRATESLRDSRPLIGRRDSSQPTVEAPVLHAREDEVLRLVGANIPSHRAAWYKDSPSLKKFMRSGRDQSVVRTEDEKNLAEDDDSEFGVVGSVPIPRIARSRSNRTSTFASFQPPLNIPNHASLSSSATFRREIYAERDRFRSLDPGALDFAEDVDVDSDDDTLNRLNGGSGKRGHIQALKILQARSKIPEAGMWRSLA